MNNISRYQVIGDKVIVSDIRLDQSKYHQRLYSEFDNEFLGMVANVNESLYNKLEKDFIHKLKAVSFHLTALMGQIKEIPNPMIVEEQFRAVNIGRKLEIQNDVLIYETEAFLFQVKSSLDILIQAFQYIYSYLTPDSRGREKSFEDGIKLFKDNGESKLYEYLELENNLWIEEVKKLRDILTHKSKLDDFVCFQISNKDGVYSITLPKINQQTYLKDFCDEIFDHLIKFSKRLILDYVVSVKVEGEISRN